MEPIKIEAVKGPDGVHIESFDAAELFEQGGAALSEKRYDDAITAYDRLLKEFADSRYTKAALYNCGLAYQGKKDWPAAIARFKVLSDQYGDDARRQGRAVPDGRVLRGAGELADLGRGVRADPAAQGPERRRQDRGAGAARVRPVQAQGPGHRRADVQVGAGLLPARSSSQERLQTDFYLGLCKYHLGEIPHERFRAAPLRLPEKQMRTDMEEKARLLLFAQRQYIDTIKLGNPQWASASGYQVASLYEEFYDAFIHAPMPPELLGRRQRGEARGLLRGAAEEDPDPAGEVVALERAEPTDDGAPGRAERVARQVQAGLRQAAAAARPERAASTRSPSPPPGAGRPRRRPPPLPQPPIPHPGVVPDPAPASPDQPAAASRASRERRQVRSRPLRAPIRQIL